MPENQNVFMKFQTVRGMRDFSPEEMAKRQKVLDIIRKVFERFGYLPLDTPAVESFELLAAKGGGGEEIKKEIYYFKDLGDRELGLRFDLTVPLARFVISNPEIPKPFKRYQIGKVWRYDKPQKGRFREFMQTDVDIVGSSTPESDAEIVAVAADCLKELGFADFIIRINNRKIVEDFVRRLDISDPVEIFRTLDKLDKLGKDIVIAELKQKKVPMEKIEKIINFVEGKEDYSKLDGAEELNLIVENLKELGYSDNIKVDLSMVRGLEYYTGAVFEVSLGGKLSVAGGGRYDKMIEFFGGPTTPATGISLGFERVVEVMKEKGMFDSDYNIAKVFVAGVNSEMKPHVIEIAKTLRKKGINTEVDLMGRNLSKQLDYVSKLNIPFCVIVGPKEVEQKEVVVRNMKNGKEQRVKMDSIIDSFA